MARYYLHLRDLEGVLHEDDEGSELPSLAVAREQALRGVHELVGEAIKHDDELRYEAIVVADEQGAHLAAVPVVAALPSTIVSLLKHPETVVPTDRLNEYRHHADECRRKAESTADIDDKMCWLKLANAWLDMVPPTQSATVLADWPKPSDEDSKTSH